MQLAPTVRSKHWAGDDLLIVDGPLRGHTHLDRTVGYIKAHHASYQAPGRYPGTDPLPLSFRSCVHFGRFDFVMSMV